MKVDGFPLRLFHHSWGSEMLMTMAAYCYIAWPPFDFPRFLTLSFNPTTTNNT